MTHLHKNKYNINKIALFTDIHWGAKSNSDQHNQDCLDFVQWMRDEIINDPSIQAIGFLGDWNENRNSVNISTMNFAYRGAKLLNELNLPIFFIIGNHDLYHRHTRELHSVISYDEFSNIQVIDVPTIISNKCNDFLLCPFMFEHEYPDLMQHLNIPVWMGHFEFKGYEVTGYGLKMQTGPDATQFAGPTHILSGHFHKRQYKKTDNIVYIGNTFPTTFGDTGDVDRGMAIYDLSDCSITFNNWDDCPRYIKTTLTTLLDDKIQYHNKSTIKCLVDIPISYEESNVIRNNFIDKYDLRDLILEESAELESALTDTPNNTTDSDVPVSTDEIVKQLLHGIDSDSISNATLISIYDEL